MKRVLFLFNDVLLPSSLRSDFSKSREREKRRELPKGREGEREKIVRVGQGQGEGPWQREGGSFRLTTSVNLFQTFNVFSRRRKDIKRDREKEREREREREREEKRERTVIDPKCTNFQFLFENLLTSDLFFHNRKWNNTISNGSLSVNIFFVANKLNRFLL